MPGAVVIAAWMVVAIVMASLLAGVIRGDPAGMVRLLLVRLPVAILLTYLATWLVALLLDLTDIASGWVLHGGISGLEQWTNQIQGQGIGSDFLSVVACLALIVATLLGYLELLAREAAIYIVTAFIPLIAAASLWPGAHNALKRGAETLFVLCVSKFVLVFVLVLGAAALTAPDVHTFSPLLTGTLIFLIAALAPAAIFRLVPILEASAVAGLVGEASRFGRGAARGGHGALGAGLAGAGGATGWLRDRVGPQASSRAGSGTPPGGGELSIAGLGGGSGPGGDRGGGPDITGTGASGPVPPGGNGSGPTPGASSSARSAAVTDHAEGPELAGVGASDGRETPGEDRW